MSITRRTVLRTLAATGATAVLPRRASARDAKRPSENAVGVLYDPTRCIGCKRCIVGCAEANGGDADLATADGAELSTRSLTVLQLFHSGGEEAFRKVQCMHCVDPACVSACMLGAMRQGEDGAVTWNGDLCVGCRYCQIACPFNVPRFEWDTPLPRLTKCDLCSDRRARGFPPACVERCHRAALIYGKREDLLKEARFRIAQHPERYEPKVYGEHDGGGTSVLYLAKAGTSFAQMGLPELGDESVPSLPETIQHTLYKGFVAPLALFGMFAAVVSRNSRKLRAEEAATHRHEHSEPVGGRLITWPFSVLATLFLAGVAVILWRFVVGLGATTNLNDGYPMGLWIAFDVVTGTALACGGYAVALLVYLLNRGRYHPLVRAAIVTSALGYTLGGISVLIDIGRAWNFYKIPLFFWEWNINSILLEVALCIMLYTGVLWIELSPAILDRWRESRVEGLRRVALALSPGLERAMPFLIALGMVLPTMHQSSLGSLMLMAGQKLHPLWHTPLLPALFLVSCVAMGYAAVTLEATISSKVFRRPSEVPMLRALGRPIAVVLLAYAAVRALDVAVRGRLDLALALDFHSLLFLTEMALFVLPAIVLLLAKRRAGAGVLVTAAMAVILGGALYRFSTYLIAFDPGPDWSYFPSLAELAVTIGLVSAELMGYLFLVKRFPILRGAPRDRDMEEPGMPIPSGAPLPIGAPEPDLSVAVTSAVRGPALGAGVLLVLMATAAALGAQDTESYLGDLRCLTDQPDQCLPEPVAEDEPHGAICATCHDLWNQSTLAEAVNTCATAGCHADPQDLTPFHRTLHVGVIDDCLGCHEPHDAEIPGGGENCLFCHGEAGNPIAFAGVAPPPRPEVAGLPGSITFDHPTHDAYACTRCHAANEQHEEFRVTELDDCRSCHHTEPVASDCLACHDGGGNAPSTTRQMIRTLGIEIGGLDHPQRLLPFQHVTHERVRCTTCHTEGHRLGATETDCTACHQAHHQPTASCSTCHPAPSEGAHDRQAHLGCGGAGCHEQAAASILATPRTRSVCLSCHRELTTHYSDQECMSCHILPPPEPRPTSGAPGNGN